MNESQPGSRSAIRRPVLMLSVLVVLICVFTVVGVAHIMELGSAAFFVVVVAGAVVLMCFFCGLIAYARARLLAVRIAAGESIRNGSSSSVPVFYFLQTSPPRAHLTPVDSTCYWSTEAPPNPEVYIQEKKDSSSSLPVVSNDQCPICLCDFENSPALTGTSECCKRPIHVQCAQKYFNTVQRVQCPLCRHVFKQEV